MQIFRAITLILSVANCALLVFTWTRSDGVAYNLTEREVPLCRADTKVVGTTCLFTQVPEVGWLEADGQEIDANKYPKLYKYFLEQNSHFCSKDKCQLPDLRPRLLSASAGEDNNLGEYRKLSYVKYGIRVD